MPALTTTLTLARTCKPMNGGVDAIAVVNALQLATLSGVWAVGDKWTLILTDSTTAVQTQIGAGNVTGIVPTSVFVYDKKVYVLAGSTVYFSVLDDATIWNDPNGVGNSFVTLSNQFANPEALAAMTIYQGKAVFISRQTTLIYAIDPDPALWRIHQTLQNIGTVSGKSVQSLGEMEVMMLADSGIRSLRVRETSLNAFVNDIGSPIDSLVQTLLATLTDTEKAASCSIVEPSSNRYWLFVPGHSGAQGTIYVLSYFPSAQIIAWSTYDPTYVTETSLAFTTQSIVSPITASISGLTIGNFYHWIPGGTGETLTCGTGVYTAETYFYALATSAIVSGTVHTEAGQYSGLIYSVVETAFTPQSFVVYKGQVFCRDATNLYAFGGSGGNVYDAVSCKIEPPWLSGQSPATRKNMRGVDVAMDGVWDVSIGTNIANEDDLKTIYSNSGSSFFVGGIAVNRISPFYKLRMKSRGTGAAKFCSVLMHFEPGDRK